MKITQKLDRLEYEHDLFKPLSSEQMRKIFGDDFKQKLIPLETTISYELIFEEEHKLYQSVFRVVNFANDTYNITKQKNKLYKELDDTQLRHYLYLIERYEYVLEHYKQIVDHPAYRLRAVFLEKHPLGKAFPLKREAPHGH